MKRAKYSEIVPIIYARQAGRSVGKKMDIGGLIGYFCGKMELDPLVSLYAELNLKNVKERTLKHPRRLSYLGLEKDFLMGHRKLSTIRKRYYSVKASIHQKMSYISQKVRGGHTELSRLRRLTHTVIHLYQLWTS